jgi:hypothetical protein
MSGRSGQLIHTKSEVADPALVSLQPALHFFSLQNATGYKPVSYFSEIFIEYCANYRMVIKLYRQVAFGRQLQP